MKKLLCLICFFVANQAFAGDRIIEVNRDPVQISPKIKDGKPQLNSSTKEFFFKPALSLEYSVPRFTQSGINSRFKSDGTLSRQLGDINNIAVGGNFRVHKYWGFNANWAQGDLLNSEIQGEEFLSERAKFSFDQYNLSALFYIPAVENLFEIFAEAGVTDMRSKLKYGDSNGGYLIKKSHETLGFYGAGFQITLNEKDAIRVSWQKYAGRIGLVNSEYSTMRVGYLMSF